MQKAEMGHRDYRTTDYGTRGERGSGNGECRQAPPKLHPCDIVKGMQKGECRMKNSVRLHQGYIKATSKRLQGVLIAT